MLGTSCDQCGGPAPLSLASPGTAQCAFCHAEVLVPDAVSRGLRERAEVVRQGDASRRQLSAFRARMASLLRRLLAAYGVATAVLVLLSVLAVIGGFVTWREGDVWVELVTVGSASALGTLLLGAAGFFGLRVLVRRAEAGWAAVPLPSGDGIACRVCGGELADRAHVVRCHYCGADNLASPALLARHREQLQKLQLDLESAEQSSPLVLDAAIACNLGLPVVTLIVCFVTAALVAGFVTPVVREARIEPDASERYAVVYVRPPQRSGKGRTAPVWECLANIQQTEGGARLFLGADTSEAVLDARGLQRVTSPRARAGVSASWLVGKTLYRRRLSQLDYQLGDPVTVSNVFQRFDSRGNWFQSASSRAPSRLPVSNPDAMDPSYAGTSRRGEVVCFGEASVAPEGALSFYGSLAPL